MAAKHRILVIDDNQEIHEDFKKILGTEDETQERSVLEQLTEDILGEKTTPLQLNKYLLDFADQGKDGLSMVQQAVEQGQPYELAFVDVRMPPGWDGIETIKHLWQADKNIQTVIITAYADYNWLDIVAELGHSDRLLILKKPFESIEIRQLASALCEKWIVSHKENLVNQALLESQSRYADLYDNSPDMYVSVDADTALVKQCNQTLADRLGYSKAQIVGSPIFKLYHPACMEEVKTAFRTFLETGEIQNAELQLMCKDGSKIEVNLNASSVRDNKGNILYSRSCWIDIGDRKRAERELESVKHYLQLLIDSMPSSIIGLDADMQITHLNTDAGRLFGVRQEEAQGKHLDDLFPLLAVELKQARDTINRGEIYKREKFIYTVDGVGRIAEVMIYPLQESDNEAIVIRMDDITERVKMQEVMTQTEKMMSVGGLAAGMAHEINNPLGGIQQGLQNIRRRFSLDLATNIEQATALGIDLNSLHQYMEQRQILHFMDDMVDAVHRASRIVNNMLSFSRKAEAVFSNTDINRLIDKTLELASIDYDMKKRYDFRTIEISKHYDPRLPQVPCVASEIQQVLLNISRNAAQAMLVNKEQNKALKLAIHTSYQNNWVKIALTDNGPGMTEDIRRHIFEPFYTTKAQGEGTGLGLSVSYFIIVESHGGKMRVESEPGNGCTFILELPVDNRGLAVNNVH